MKNIAKFTTIILFVILSTSGMGQSPPHPNEGNTPGAGNTPVGGGAPIGGGLFIMLSLIAGYGVKKLYSINKKDLM